MTHSFLATEKKKNCFNLPAKRKETKKKKNRIIPCQDGSAKNELFLMSCNQSHSADIDWCGETAFSMSRKLIGWPCEYLRKLIVDNWRANGPGTICCEDNTFEKTICRSP
ncbi:hypothetical protein CEXT_148591 [Caerostris extrusa]|uniref:Uncharacterized protein n=1 Tax=Caerostris extrusa TaxID=172846 RepID=A0AAV4V096_CAEEX|nr:hypothetical protein CEXT_148591 [Caerostris extrusa]